MSDLRGICSVCGLPQLKHGWRNTPNRHPFVGFTASELAEHYPVVYKVEVTRQDLGLSVKFWARLTSTKNRPAVLRALEDAILELTAIRQEVQEGQ